MEKIIAGLGWFLIAFLLGSVPFGLIVARTSKGIDPRLWGSGNTGASNVARVCGTGAGVLTFILDMLKGFLPVLFAMAVSTSALFLSLTALAALLGHMYSVFLNGKGGKGVATTIGIFAALTPGPLFWALILCLLLIWATGYVSLGSLTLTAALPLFIIISGHFSYIILSLIVMFLIYSRHKDNILRLAKGEEHPWEKSKYSASV